MKTKLQHPAVQWQDQDLVLSLKVQPRASRNAIVGIHGGRIKVRLTAAPVDGQANTHLLKLFSKLLNIPLSQLKLERGLASRTKTVRITAPTPAVADRLLPFL